VLQDCKTQFFTNWFLVTQREVNQLKTTTVVKQLGVALVAFTIIFVFIPGTQARPLVFTMYMKFNPAVLSNPEVPIWWGPVEGAATGYMEFFAVGPTPAHDVGYNPDNPLGTWEVHFFEEEWTIYIGDFYIKGVDKGTTTASDWTFRMNGKVTEANGPYWYLVGHRVHMEGQITWNWDDLSESTAIGPIQIN